MGENSMDIMFENVILVNVFKNRIDEIPNIGVKNGKIAYMGSGSNSIISKRVINCKDKIMLPGLYNCHTHTPMSLLKGISDNAVLQTWLQSYIIPAESYFRKQKKSIYWAALLSIADMISSGVVAFSDMYFNMPEIAMAVEKSEIKANLCNPVLWQSDLRYTYTNDMSYVETVDMIKKYNNNDKLKIDVGIHAEYTSSPECWSQVVDFAQSNNLRLQIHVSETQAENQDCLHRYSKTPVGILNEYGVFDCHTSIAHGVWLEDNDIDLLKSKEVTLVHNPISNLKLASGISDVKSWIDAGINVSLGTDSVASNNSYDIFEEIKICSLLQKYLYNDPNAVQPYDILHMATVNGAYAQGRAENSGKIQLGFDADLILLDFNNVRQNISYDYVSNIIYSVTARDLYLNMCKGVILYENGEYNTIDVEKVMYETKAIVNKYKKHDRSY